MSLNASTLADAPYAATIHSVELDDYGHSFRPGAPGLFTCPIDVARLEALRELDETRALLASVRRPRRRRTPAMAATRRQPQHLIALGIANHHRLARAGLRADVADAGAQHDAPARARTSAHALAAILEAPPACVLGARLDGVLRWAHGIGPVRHANVPCTRSAGSTRTPTSTGRR